MRLINSSVDVVKPTGYTLQDIYEQIELAGRTCYKSEDKITEESAKGFVDRMITSKHNAMLEHGTVYLTITPQYNGVVDKYRDNKYSIVKIISTSKSTENCYITTNYRVLVENDWLEDLKYLCEPTQYHEKRITARFICDRGVSHELVRHRVFSFAQESTRYCNYSKDKFGGELTFIIPSCIKDIPNNISFNDSISVTDFVWKRYDNGDLTLNVDKFTQVFLYNLIGVECDYVGLINNGYKPQEARQLLPNALKTEVVMTGFASDWDHFFELRCAKTAHPDMQKLANELKEQF